MSTTAAARVMARGRHIELRLWERDPAGQRALSPTRPTSTAYVQAGALIVLIGDEPPLEVHAGDSYVVPAGLGHVRGARAGHRGRGDQPVGPLELISGSFTYAPG